MSKRTQKLKSLSNETLKKVVGGLPRGGWDPSSPSSTNGSNGGGTQTANDGGGETQSPKGSW